MEQNNDTSSTFTNSSSKVYFSHADPRLEDYIQQKQFKQALISRLLLEPGIIIPDVFFLTSKRVSEDVLSPHSWIMAGLRHKLIIPATRNSDVDLSSSFQEIFDSKTISGAHKNTVNVRESLHYIDASERIIWPKGVGVSYRDTLKKFLATDDSNWLSSLKSYERELWERSADLRYGCIERALELSPGVDEHGIRRSDMYRALAEAVRFDGETTLTQQILFKAREMGLGREASALHLWISELYEYNQAKSFEYARACFPVAGVPGAGVLANRLENSKPVKNNPIFDVNYEDHFAWPRTSRLLETDPEEILRVRVELEGIEYFQRLKRFRSQPNDATWGQLSRALTEYGHALCAVTNDNSSRIWTKFGPRHLPWAGLVGVLAADLGQFVSDSLPVQILSTAIGVSAVLVPDLVPGLIGNEKMHLEIGENGYIQIDTPTT